MKRQIVIEIDAADGTCLDCKKRLFIHEQELEAVCFCTEFLQYMPSPYRLPECLAAEQKAKEGE